MELCDKIKHLRKQVGLTQSEFAEKLFVTRQSVQKWETGVASPDVMKLKDIARIFGVTVDQLLDEEIDEKALALIFAGVEEKPAPAPVRTHSAMDWLVLIPAYVGVGILVFMAYFFGAMLVAMLFTLAIGAPIYGVYSLINVFFVSGISAKLISVSFTFVGLGLGIPCFQLGKWWLEKYKKIVAFLGEKIKKVKDRVIKK